MEFIFRETKLKYEDGKLYRFRYNKWKECSIKLDSSGCKGSIAINKKSFIQHRIIYLIHNPEWDIYNPRLNIHHLNQNRADNRIENLKEIPNLSIFYDKNNPTNKIKINYK